MPEQTGKLGSVRLKLNKNFTFQQLVSLVSSHWSQTRIGSAENQQKKEMLF